METIDHINLVCPRFMRLRCYTEELLVNKLKVPINLDSPLVIFGYIKKKTTKRICFFGDKQIETIYFWNK